MSRKGLKGGRVGKKAEAIDEMISEVRNEIKMISRSVADAAANVRDGIENRSTRKRSHAFVTTTTTATRGIVVTRASMSFRFLY